MKGAGRARSGTEGGTEEGGARGGGAAAPQRGGRRAGPSSAAGWRSRAGRRRCSASPGGCAGPAEQRRSWGDLWEEESPKGLVVPGCKWEFNLFQQISHVLPHRSPLSLAVPAVARELVTT